MSDTTQLQDDILVNLKALNKKTETNIRLLPRTKAEAIIETDEQQFISKTLKDSIPNKQDKLGYIPVNKAGDKMSGPLYLLSSFNDPDQAVSKAYVDQKIENLIASSPEALDTLYELAAAIGNNPNFATTITNLIATKLNSSEVTNIRVPNKVLRLDADGDLNANIKGNSETASKLKNSIIINVGGPNITPYSTFTDGSQNIDLQVNILPVSAYNTGLMTEEDYKKLYSLQDLIKEELGIRAVTFTSSEFAYNSSEDIYTYSYNYSTITKNSIGHVQVYQKDNSNGFYCQVNTDIVINDNFIIINSINRFDGKLIFDTCENVKQPSKTFTNIVTVYGKAPWFHSSQTKNISNLEEYDDHAIFKVNILEDLSDLFLNCTQIISIDLSDIDTSNTTNMYDMFYNCSSLSNELDVSNLDTSNVTNMSFMFSNTKLNSIKGLNAFDTSKVTKMQYMFCGEYFTSLDLSSFNTSNVVNMAGMFCPTAGILDLSNFDTSKVTDMYWMFGGSEKLSELNISNFDTSKVTNMSCMFQYCGAKVNSGLNIICPNGLDLFSCQDVGWMFDGAIFQTPIHLKNVSQNFIKSGDSPNTWTLINKAYGTKGVHYIIDSVKES